MKRTVVWLNSAEQELAELWLEAADRDAITNAASMIDQLLRANPESEGEGHTPEQG